MRGAVWLLAPLVCAVGEDVVIPFGLEPPEFQLRSCGVKHGDFVPAGARRLLAQIQLVNPPNRIVFGRLAQRMAGQYLFSQTAKHDRPRPVASDERGCCRIGLEIAIDAWV